MKKILATIDFDGVISPIDNAYDFSADPAFRGYRLGAFRCYIAEPVRNFANWLASQNEIETEWATSWEGMTEHFHEDTKGDLPHLPYIKVGRNKGDSILDRAVKLGVSEVHVFEDDGRVRTRINLLMKRTPEKYQFRFVFHKTALKKGLTEKDIESAKTVLLSGISRND